MVAATVLLQRWLPFQDLAGHAGHLAIRERLANSPFEQRFLVDAARPGPYSLFRVLGHFFAQAWGALGALRALTLLPMVATPWAVVRLRRRLSTEGWDPTYALIGLFACLGLMLMFGFASYLTGTAVMLVALDAFLAIPESRTPWRHVALAAAFAVFTFYAHGFSLLVLGALVLAIIATDVPRMRQMSIAAALVPAGVCALSSQLALRDVTAHVSKSEALAPTLFQGPLDKLSLLVSPMLISRFGVDVALGLLLWGSIFVGAWTCWGRNNHWPSSVGRKRVLRGGLALLGLFLLLPHNAHWFGFVDGRLLPTSFLLVALALPEGWWTARRRDAAALLTVAQCTVLATCVAMFQSEMQGFDDIAQALPNDMRVLNFPIDANSRYVVGHPFVHVDKLLVLKRPELLSDLWLHQGTGLYARDANPALHLPSQYASTQVQEGRALEGISLEEWDYALLRKESMVPPPVPPGWEPRRQSGAWWLYARRDAP